MLNKVMLIGRVGADPEVISTSNGMMLAKVNLATNFSYKNKVGEYITKTEWHKCTAWNTQAEFIGSKVKKGYLLYIEGMIEYNSYEKNGINIKSTEIVIQKLKILNNVKDSA